MHPNNKNNPREKTKRQKEVKHTHSRYSETTK